MRRSRDRPPSVTAKRRRTTSRTIPARPRSTPCRSPPAGQTTEAGTVNEVTSYPTNYWTLDQADYAPDTLFPCTLDFQIRGFCPSEQKLVSYNPLEQNSPFIRGWRERYGADVAGGSDLAQYFIGGDFYREQGVYSINRQRQISLRGNIHSQPRENFDIAVNAGDVQSRLRLPQNANNVRGIIPGGLLGTATPHY